MLVGHICDLLFVKLKVQSEKLKVIPQHAEIIQWELVIRKMQCPISRSCRIDISGGVSDLPIRDERGYYLIIIFPAPAGLTDPAVSRTCQSETGGDII